MFFNYFSNFLRHFIIFLFFRTVGKQGLAGAAERMRNLVSQELDVVVSVKEAKQSREQLIKDRTTLNKQLTDLKRKQRVTMTNAEREEMSKKIAELEEDMALRNAQISELQKQIMDADANDNENNVAHASGNAKWWDSLSTMTEAKIALQYLFEKAADNMATLSNVQSSSSDLKAQYDEAIKTIEGLEDEINGLKYEHEEKMVELGKDFEERVSYLLNQLTNKDSQDSSASSDLMNKEENSNVQKFSKLTQMILELQQGFAQKKKPKAKAATQRMTEEEFFEEEGKIS